MQSTNRFLIFALILMIFSATAHAQDGWKTFTHPIHKYSISYPADWIERDKTDYMGFLSPPEDSTDKLSENVNVVVEDYSQKIIMTLDTLVRQNKAAVKKMMGPESKLEESRITLLGEPTSMFDNQWTNNGYHMHLRQFYLIHNNVAYIFTFTALDMTFYKYEETAMKIINSFKFPQ